VNEIFLSYRRADEKGTTGRLFDHLVQAFGKQAIFYDVDKIPHGTDFRRFIDNTIRNCRVALVVIGPAWLDITDQNGRRLDQLDDPVRIEVEAALRYGKRLIPVLIDDAQMPNVSALPETMAQLASQNAAPLHNNQYFEQDINTLINDIASIGVRRKVEGTIINPPVAGLPTLTRRQTATVVGVPLVFIALGLIATLVVGYLGYQSVASLISGGANGSGAINGGGASDAHATLTHFCAELGVYSVTSASSNLSSAYADLTPAFQARIGSATNLPIKLTSDVDGSQVTVAYCHPFDQSSSDAYYRENGNTATDEVQFEALTATGEQTTISNQTMYFVKQGGSWKIDKVQRHS
jgi:hypothetical protein